MDFSFTEEQTLLRNTVQRFVQDRYDFDTRQKIVTSPEGWRQDYWQQMAELGLLAAPFSEEQGGLGGSAIDVMIVMEEFGRGLVVEPYLPTVVIAGGFLRHGGSAAMREALIPEIIGGTATLAFAYAEPQGRYDLKNLTTRAEKKGGSFVLNGHKAVVIGAPWADKLIVTARTGGGQSDEHGVTVFLVDKGQSGVRVRDYPTVDGFRAAEVTFDNVALSADAVIGEVDNGLPLIEQVSDEAIAALCAEAIGIMKVLTDTTVEYSRNRKQFGAPIGSFQVLQHRMVDMYVNYEQSVSITYMANMKIGDAPRERSRAVSSAKAHIGKAARFVGQSAVQIHGGMGVTEELNVGHYFKRLTMIDTMFGNADFHVKRFRELSA